MSEPKWNRNPIEGVEVWKNPKNKFLIFQLHYSADSRKRDPAYRDVIKSAMPIRQYMQEYELQWDSFAGARVYDDFQKRIHTTSERILPEVGLPLLRGWDFGLTPACVVAQLVGNQLRIIKEFTELNMGAKRFSAEVLKQCAILWPAWHDPKLHWRDFIDPAGQFRKDTDEGTCATILAEQKLVPIAGPVAWEARRQSVEHFLTLTTKEGPGFIMNGPDCPVLLRGFEGGYRYPEKAFDKEPNQIRPIKDEHSHPHDALQYICSKMMTFKRRSGSGIAAPSYSREIARAIKQAKETA